MAGDFTLYQYEPSQIACLVALGLFGVSLFYHLFQMVKKKTWFYTCLVIGSFSEFHATF